MENNNLEKMKEETTRKEINRLRDEIIALEDAVSQCKTYAGYIKSLAEMLVNGYFVSPQPNDKDMMRLEVEYIAIKNFLEIAHDYANKIKEVEADYGLLQYMS